MSAIIEKNLLKTVLIKSPSAITHGNCSSALERPPRGVFEGRISFWLHFHVIEIKAGWLFRSAVPASTGVIRGPGSLVQGSRGSPCPAATSMAVMADCGGDRRVLGGGRGSSTSWRRSDPHLRHTRLIPGQLDQPAVKTFSLSKASDKRLMGRPLSWLASIA